MSSSASHMPISGSIHVIVGPMFSGKTTELMRIMERHRIAGRRCLMVKYQGDTRYSENDMVTHSGKMEKAMSVMSAASVLNIMDNYDVFCFDEGQFMGSLSDTCEYLADRGKIVIVAALNCDYKRTARFQNMSELLCVAEEITSLKAVCVICGNDASFTHRTSKDTDLEVIGGADKYEARCRNCHPEKCM